MSQAGQKKIASLLWARLPLSNAYQKSRLADREHGFTLAEVAIVSVLLALLASLIYGSITGIMRTKKVLDEQRTVLSTAQYVMSRMTRELANRVEEPLSSEKESARASSAGESGGEQSGDGEEGGEAGGEEEQAADQDEEFDVYLLGINRRDGDRDADSIRFVSSGGGQVVFQGAQNIGLVEISYELLGGSTSMHDGNDSSRRTGFTLVRAERPAGKVDEKVRAARTIRFPMSERIESLNLRYRKRSKWLDEWSEKEEGLPEAVEISLTVSDDSGSSSNFRTAVPLTREPKRRAEN